MPSHKQIRAHTRSQLGRSNTITACPPHLRCILGLGLDVNPPADACQLILPACLLGQRLKYLGPLRLPKLGHH